MVSTKNNKNYINNYLNLNKKKFKVRYHDIELYNILKKLITHKNYNILDLGCGNGGSTIYLQKK